MSVDRIPRSAAMEDAFAASALGGIRTIFGLPVEPDVGKSTWAGS
jgi:hypothetical protein